ncbi:hypothetical protein GOP47_0024795 [Adiantum capillus-veneris]|uniref:Uracil-DNA glycosylase n=1 Tax=Adiantum capillus-veneris TaxID=13818 RepID=A0A9D4U3H8_ADICA|nr:hypothetical protein GOP47_0024795 [Adiantum capillus-veneris]
MIPPPSQPPSLSGAASSPWSSDVVDAHVSSDISAASTRQFLNAEARCSAAQALPSSSGACHVRFPGTSLASPYSMTPSVCCFPDMADSNKRPCKAVEASNCRCRVSVLGCYHVFDPRFRVSAFTGHGQRVPFSAELEQIEDGDESMLQVKKIASRKMKSAEELHFEAIEGYCLRYENEDNAYYEGDAGVVDFEGDVAPVYTASLDDNAFKTPINENKYLDASGVVPWSSDGGYSIIHSNGSKADTLSPKNVSFNDEELQMPGKVSQSLRTANVSGIDGPKVTRVITENGEMAAVSQDEGSARKLTRRKTVRACSLNKFQHRDTLDEEAEQNQIFQSQNKELKSNEDSSNSDRSGDLSEEQKIRMELNKAAALARRHMRSCEDAVAEAEARGLPFPKFASLLVEKSWAESLSSEFQKPYMERLQQFVTQEAAGRIPIYPPPAKLFNAFNSCPLDKVKVVIIGQDPYHGPAQAMGLCFSVEKGVKLPSSLTNIFLEIQSDLDFDFPSHGNLEKWAHQGVLLLNTVLTVRDRHANSHAKKGWELFTDAAIRTVVQQRSGVVFLLWGNQAQEKLRLINKTSHHILKAFHPSGISAHRGFFMCRHFSKANQLLVDEGLLPIDWQL